MTQFYLVHIDQHGEPHQLSGSWEAETGKEAIAKMLDEAMTDDDGQWEAHEVTSPDDVFC